MTDRLALLALADGTTWSGRAFGAIGERTGELVFNTSMAGYQEVLTDPSYHGQIVVMTQPHIGNYGVNAEDGESDRCWPAGFAVRAASPIGSNWRATQTLAGYLEEQGVAGISEVDTRALVRHIRTYGAMNAALSSARADPDYLVARARAARGMNGLDLVTEVGVAEAYAYPPSRDLNASFPAPWPVVAYDFGIKRNILRQLAARNCCVTVVPPRTPAGEVLAHKPAGVLLSNGPGDPAAVTYAIENTRQLLGRVPVFGICLGHQILALALGGTTYKLKFGHRGCNHPVKELRSGRVAISSHNHGFAVRAESLPATVEVTHIDLDDGCVEGLAAASLRAFAVQYHPESAPGPHDSLGLFDQFVEAMREG